MPIWDYGDGCVIEEEYLEEVAADLRRCLSMLQCEYLFYQRNYESPDEYCHGRPLALEDARLILELGRRVNEERNGHYGGIRSTLVEEG